MESLKIGWSEISITPDKKISLVGQFAERISQYVEKPLIATALAIESDTDQLVLVSCDLAYIGWSLLADVRATLADNTVGFDPEKLILCATHTHTGPGYTCQRSRGDTITGTTGLRTLLESFLEPGQKYVEKVNISANPEIATGAEVAALLKERLATVILEAWNSRGAGSFANAFGRAPVGQCRRTLYSDDTAQMWGNSNTAVFQSLEGGNDSGIELMYMFDGQNALSGIVVNLACPAQCVQHRLFVSPDFWGEVRVRLRKYFGEHIHILTLCSPAGDQCPVDLVRWVEPESDINDPNCVRDHPPKRKADPSMFDLSGMYKAGKRIANEVIEVWEEGLDQPQETPVFIHQVQTMPLPLRRASLTDVKQAEQGIREYLRNKQGQDVDYNDVARLQVHMGVLNRAKKQEQLDVLDAEVHIIRLGTVAIASNPFELFLDYGNQIRARSAAEQTFLIQMANGAEGYLPTEKAERHGHYSAFISSGQVGHVGGEQLVRQTLQTIRQLFREEG